MNEWWTYRPSDLLMFSAATYRRLFELANAELWPLQPLLVAVGAGMALALWQRRAWSPRMAFAVLGAAWLWVAWNFHWQRFAGIQPSAALFAAVFAAQGLLLLGAAAVAGATAPGAVVARPSALALGLLLFALLGYPALAMLLGRPWTQAEVWAVAPDPTVLATLGVLLAAPPRRGAIRWLVWPAPLLWCAASGLTLWTMGAAEAPLLPAAGLAAAVAAAARARVRPNDAAAD